MSSSTLFGVLVFTSALILLISRRRDQEINYYDYYAKLSLAFLFLYFIGKLVYSTILYPIFFSPFRHLPTPPGRTFVSGHFYQFINRPPGSVVQEWAESFPDHGLLRIYLFGNIERLFVTSTKGLSDVFVHRAYDFVKTDQLKASLSRIAGMGILLAEGDEHKMQRKHLNPAFSYRHVKDLYPIFWAKSVEMIQGIESAINDLPEEKRVIEIKDWASRTTLDIIGLAGMDNDFESLSHSNNSLNMHYRKTLVNPPMHVKLLRLLGLFINPRLLNRIPIEWNRSINESNRVIREECLKIISKKKQKFDKKETMGVDILSVAMQSGAFSEENLVDQMMTFLLAGHETTSTALQWVIYHLSLHPGIQSRLRSEIHASLPSSLLQDPSQITAPQIDSLPYLNAVCNEVLRISPSVPLTLREACRDTSIDNIPIPKGTLIVLSLEATNYNVDLWGPDAAVFNPERWLGPGKAKTGGAQSNYALSTFIHGPRSCIGQGFSRAELACLVAAVVGRFEVELEDPEKKVEKAGIGAGPKDGVRARVRVVEGW